MEFISMPASPVSVLLVMFTYLVTPFYMYFTYVKSEVSESVGAWLAWVWMALGAGGFLLCFSGVPYQLGLPGNLLVPLCWLTPSLFLVFFRKRLRIHRLNQRWLVGIQVFRLVGAVFLIEMWMGNQPGIFAYPAGIGDVIVGLITIAILWRYPKGELPRKAILLVYWAGMLDFVSAFFFGFSSSETPVQLFKPEVTNQILLFPTGLIPLFLVPYAIFFHTLSMLVFLGRKHENTLPIS